MMGAECCTSMMQDAPQKSNVMTAPSQGFNSGSDKHGGNDSDHQQQPNQEESTRGSEAGEVNEGSLAERDNLGSLTGITIVRNVDQQLVDSK
jgi:hypothetical protein